MQAPRVERGHRGLLDRPVAAALSGFMKVLESIGARRIMRKHEYEQLTGGFYMGIGVATTMSIAPSISTAALCSSSSAT